MVLLQLDLLFDTQFGTYFDQRPINYKDTQLLYRNRTNIVKLHKAERDCENGNTQMFTLAAILY
jgi:hypothetical protein